MTKNYSDLAVIYNHIMKKVRYDRWSEYLYWVTKEFLPDKPKVLELAAGKCSLAKLLSNYFPDIITSDLSYHMLMDSGYRGKQVCCSMLSLPFKEKFDFIYSTFDSVNYLTSKNQLIQMLTEVKGNLNEEGIFAFDVSMEKNSLKHVEDPIREGVYKGLRYTHKSEYNGFSGIHKNTFHITGAGGKETIEIHRQKIYPFSTYFEVIEKAGLYAAACYKAFSFTKATPDSERLQFIIKKSRKDAYNT